MTSCLGHGWHQRHCGRTGPNDQNGFALIIKIFGPVLRMNKLALKIGQPRKVRHIAFIIAEIATAHMQEARRKYDFLASSDSCYCPQRLGAIPARTDDLVIIADFIIDTIFSCSLSNIVENCGPVGNRFLRSPRFKIIAERVHVAIRPNTRIAKKVPCSADRITRLEDRIRLAGTFIL
ncbi:MAG: Uncharacterised protein [Hyphomonas sp. TMED17]|nr:MAG: Uncharacterised protein [Hyphomonas sp. TMED17]